MQAHTISVVIPVYLGERTLDSVMSELAPLTEETTTPAGRVFRIVEVILVHDNGPDRSDEVCRRLAAAYPWIRLVWMSRNFGQHPATIAGIASSGASWIVTMDEDGQHDPRAIGAMLDLAVGECKQVVYARPSNPPPHGWARNATSKVAKFVATHLLTGGRLPQFHSYRLILGEVGRGMAAFCGSGVYLDVALSWVSADVGHLPVAMRAEGDRQSGYSWRRLLSHFWQLVISSGTRPLRLVSVMGVVLAASGFVFAIVTAIRRAINDIEVPGWTSVFVALLIIGGFLMLALGVIAEYVAVAVRMAMGRPLYLTVSDPSRGPLGERQNDGAPSA
jgi:glycosyltransferase involved in cell wall biosynthesis